MPNPLADAHRIGAAMTTPVTGAWPPLIASSAAVSIRMRSFPRRDTVPEVALRSLLHARGMRYRVCFPVPEARRRTIDIAFTRAKVAVFVDGCYWHGCPAHHRIPRSNRDWWREKVRRNRVRDEQTTQHLVALGWQVLRFWEHQDVQAAADAVEAACRQRAPVPATTCLLDP
jgi:DNA mismatch endonuclease (patch repair protein)